MSEADEPLWKMCKPGMKVYADLNGVGIAGRLISINEKEMTAQVDFGAFEHNVTTPLESVEPYDLT